MVDPNAWNVRRKIIVWSLIWLGLLITTIAAHGLYTGRESSLQETIVIAAFTLFGSTVGSYVFGAIWDDKNKRSTPGIVETQTRIVTSANTPVNDPRTDTIVGVDAMDTPPVRQEGP
jgi:hypothetical protein